MKRIIVLILPFLFLGCMGQPESFSSTEEFLAAGMESAGIPGLAALVIRDGQPYQSYYLGYANLEEQREVTAETAFMLASISKPVTATSVMLLVERGILDLDARADSYLPWELTNPHFPEEDITLRMLLTHCSSLQDDWDVLDPTYTIGEGGDSPLPLGEFCRDYFSVDGALYNSDKNFQQRNRPGTNYEYCNMNFALLGHIVEAVDGRSYDQFSREEVLLPLGMESAQWFLKDCDETRLAMAYTVPRRGVAQAIGHYGYASYPDGQLRCTVEDYGRFVSLFLQPYQEGSLLSEETLMEFLSIQFPETHPHQAISWNYDEFETGLIRKFLGYKPSHTGGDPGVATIAVMDPEKGAAVLVFINGYRPTMAMSKLFYVDILSALCEEAGIEP